MSEQGANRVVVIAVGTIGPLLALALPILLLVGFALTVLLMLGSVLVLAAIAVAALAPVLFRRRAAQRAVWISAFAPTPVVARVAAYQGSCPLEHCRVGREFLVSEANCELCPAARQALEAMVQRCRQGDDMARERPIFRSRICEVTFQVYPTPQLQTVAA